MPAIAEGKTLDELFRFSVNQFRYYMGRAEASIAEQKTTAALMWLRKSLAWAMDAASDHKCREMIASVEIQIESGSFVTQRNQTASLWK